MATTPLWVPLVVALVAVLGTLAGVIFTQAWNSRLDERRWVRESVRLHEAQAREDLNRTYEHRRAAYVEFFQEWERLQRIYTNPNREPTEKLDFEGPTFDGLLERWAAVSIYGTPEASFLAVKCFDELVKWAREPGNNIRQTKALEARTSYLLEIRKDLGVPDHQLPE